MLGRMWRSRMQRQGRAGGDRGFDVRLLAQAQHEAAHQAHDARHFGERDGDDHVADARLGQRHQRDGEQHRGNRHQAVHHAHHDGVEPADEAGDEPDREPDASRERRDRNADDERDARAVDDAAVDVAPEHVGAEPVLAPTAASDAGSAQTRLRVDRAEPGRQHRDRRPSRRGWRRRRSRSDGGGTRRGSAARSATGLGSRRSAVGKRRVVGHVSSGCAGRTACKTDRPAD